MRPVPSTRFLGAVCAEDRRISRALRPEPRLPHQVAARTLKPSREPYAHELPGPLRVHAGRDLRRDGRQAEAVNTELPLEPRLKDRLWMPEPRWWRPSIPLLEPASDNGNSGATVTSGPKVDNRTR